MDYIKIIGLAAAVLTTVANFPQTYKIIKEKSTEGVSGTTYIILLVGFILWLIYGIMSDDLPIIIANGISALTSIIILILNYTSDKVVEKLHEKVIPDKIKEEVKKEENEVKN